MCVRACDVLPFYKGCVVLPPPSPPRPPLILYSASLSLQPLCLCPLLPSSSLHHSVSLVLFLLAPVLPSPLSIPFNGPRAAGARDLAHWLDLFFSLGKPDEKLWQAIVCTCLFYREQGVLHDYELYPSSDKRLSCQSGMFPCCSFLS